MLQKVTVISLCACLWKLLVARLNEAFSNAKLNRDDELRGTLILTTGEIGRYWQHFCLDAETFKSVLFW